MSQLNTRYENRYERAYEKRYEKAFGLDDPRFQKLQSAINAGKHDAIRVMEAVEEFAPRDQIVSAKQIEFDVRAGKNIVAGIGEFEYDLHRNAVTQMVGRTNILTTGVANKMLDVQEPWGQELLLHNLREIFSHFPANKRFLIRSVLADEREEIRGFLSDSYRRMNVGPIFQQFAKAAINEFGAIPLRLREGLVNSYTHDLRMGLSLFLPFVFKPIDSMDEFVVIGLMVQNSDFGVAALTASLQSLRIRCSNLMITRDELRKIHLGARLSQDIRFGQDTYEKDTETMALAIRDITRALFSPERINEYNGRINRAATQEIDAGALFSRLRTSGHLLKNEEKEVKELFTSADIERLPAGNTTWRAAQAVSLFANIREQNDMKERAMELRESAGVILDEMK